MAFNTLVSGDRYIKPESGNVTPRKPASGYTAQVGDLVYIDGSANDTVALISGTFAAFGIVESLNNGNGILSVAEFYVGCTIELPYTGSPLLGNKVIFSNNTRDVALARTKIQGHASNGNGTIISKDAGAPHGTGFVVVEF